MLRHLPEIFREMMGLRTVPSPEVDFTYIDFEEDYIPWTVQPVAVLPKLSISVATDHVV
jgi:hypothetical protein